MTKRPTRVSRMPGAPSVAHDPCSRDPRDVDTPL